MGDLRFSATMASRGLDLRFEVPAGEVLAVLGPNGSGKSTTAAVATGLLHPDTALVQVGDRTLTDTARGVCVPTHDRRVGLMLQDALLFPHMSVLGNVAFAASRHTDRTHARQVARRWLEEIGVGDLADRAPGTLSGGQAQRVALARALAAEPEVLVLDEPLSGLDVAGAAAVRSALQSVVAADGRATVLITHDVLDVLALADRVLVLEGGTVAEAGAVADVMAAPRSRFGARIAGLNLVRGVLSGFGVARTADGQFWHGTASDQLTVGQQVVAVFAPAAVSVFRADPHGSPRNSVRGTIASLETVGGAVRVRMQDQSDGTPGLAADVTAEAVADLRLSPGQQVLFSVKTQGVALHPAARSAGRPR